MKRLLAFIIAVTLFFSFSVPALAAEDVPVGASDVPMLMSARSPAVMAIDPDTPAVNGSWLDGTFSLLDGKASVNNGSTSTFFTNLRSFTAPANNGKNINFIVQQSSLILRGNSPYLISFDAIVPAEPVSVSVVLTGSDGSGWVTVPVSDYSYSGGRLCINSVFMPPKAGYLRHLSLSYSDNFSSSFDVSVSSFSVTNLSTMAMDDDNWRNKGFSPDRINVFSSGGNGGFYSTQDIQGGSGSVTINPPAVEGSYHNFDVRLSAYYDKLSSLAGNYLYHLKFNVLRPNGFSELNIHDVDFGAAQVRVSYVPNVVGDNDNMAYVDVWGVVPLTGYDGTNAANIEFGMSSQRFGNFDTEFTVAVVGWDFYPVSDVASMPMVAGEDAPFAAWIGSFFSDLYNSLVGFFVSQDDDTERDFDDSYNPAVDQGISEAQSNITAAEEFEQGIFGQADSAMSQINPGGVQTPSTLINSMAFISGLWTDSYNQLPSDFQFVITFPLFLGIALMFIGRSGRVFGGMMSTRSKPLGNYVNGQRVTVIDAKYFH